MNHTISSLRVILNYSISCFMLEMARYGSGTRGDIYRLSTYEYLVLSTLLLKFYFVPRNPLVSA